MPGLFIVQGGSMDAEARSKALDGMIAADMRRINGPFGAKRDWHVEKLVDSTCGIACAHLGVYEKETLLDPSDANGVRYALFGNLSSQCKLEVARPRGDEGSSSAVGALACLYQEYGEDFPQHLSGTYVAAIWDAARERLVIASDRWGFFQHFFTRNGPFVLAPCAASLHAVWPDTEIDQKALRDLLTFGFILGDASIHKSYAVLPAATLLAVHQTARSQRRYWHFKFRPEGVGAPRRGHTDRIGELMHDAVRDLAEPDDHVVVPLSGGLDSRLLLGVLARQGRKVTTVTVGSPETCEVRFAQQIAQRYGFNHQTVPLAYEEAWPRLTWAANMHEANLNVAHDFLPMGYVSNMPDDGRILLTGFLGGIIAGWDVMVDFLLLPLRNRAAAIYQRYAKVQGTHSSQALLDVTAELMKQAGKASVQDCIPDVDQSHYEAFEDFTYTQDEHRFIGQAVCGIASGVSEPRSPFCDYRLADYFFGLRIDELFVKVVFRKAIAEILPEIADIPETFSDLPPSASRRRILWRRFGKRGRMPEWLRRQWRRLFWVPDHPGHESVDHNRLLRSAWPHVKDLFFRQGGVDAPYLDADGIRDICAEYEERGAHVYLIMHLLSYVAWYTQNF